MAAGSAVGAAPRVGSGVASNVGPGVGSAVGVGVDCAEASLPAGSGVSLPAGAGLGLSAISGTSLSQPTAMSATRIIAAKMNSARPCWDNPRPSSDRLHQCRKIPGYYSKASSQFLRTYDSPQHREGQANHPILADVAGSSDWRHVSSPRAIQGTISTRYDPRSRHCAASGHRPPPPSGADNCRFYSTGQGGFCIMDDAAQF